ncbi:MAG: 2-oxoisovalerate dehydrogenase E2 component (dihydrolipoyl transacylase) [Gammaproteobacteria bacterium]|jgi:2-oxoisovalerate dehydrogenase E2 component (dihydrolipoyl transacylase)
MGEHLIKLPDVGEGVAEAELIEWPVAVGAVVNEDDIIAVIMTDKAAVEIPSPSAGKILWLGAEIGDTLAVGAPLVRLEVSGEGNVTTAAQTINLSPVDAQSEQGAPELLPTPRPMEALAPLSVPAPISVTPVTATPRRAGDKPIAAPAVRRRAMDSGVDLRQVRGSGPAGRITHDDLDAFLSAVAAPGSAGQRLPDNTVTEIKVIGLRRKIAERMALSTSRIAHITYVDEIDMTQLEKLRESLNADRRADRPRLTILPFLLQAMVKAIHQQPAMNAHFDDEAGIIRQYGGVHIGVATQTPSGLVVPVIRHVEARDLWDGAVELSRLSELARSAMASRLELSGSTITITSLGALGGLVSTPVINHPEVAIIGVNKLQIRPFWDGQGFVPRKMMNLSSSFDHRVIDGWDAAVFIQAIKRQLENPATIFMED